MNLNLTFHIHFMDKCTYHGAINSLLELAKLLELGKLERPVDTEPSIENII